MTVDIYQTQNAAKVYVFVETGADVSTIIPPKFQAALQSLVIMETKVEITAGQQLIGLDASQILADIEEKNFSLQSAMIRTDD